METSSTSTILHHTIPYHSYSLFSKPVLFSFFSGKRDFLEKNFPLEKKWKRGKKRM